MAAPKKKVCKRLVHNGTERVACGMTYAGAECPRRDHLLKYPTGYCNIGSCEGTKAKSASGKPMPTCEFFTTCPCECHKRLDEMFKLTGMERIVVENPEYIPEKIDFNIEDYMKPLEADAPFSAEPTVGPDGVEVPVSGSHAPAVTGLTQRRTDTGRAARGGLEAQVWEQCAIFAQGNIEATPKMLAELIAKKYKIPTPSTGAIGAVFNRWEKLGFAEQGKKPVRFLKFTGEGTWQELERIKGRAKRDKRRTQSALQRGFR